MFRIYIRPDTSTSGRSTPFGREYKKVHLARMLNIYAKSLPDVSVDQPFYYVLVLLPLAETNANAPRTLVTDDLARCVLTADDSCRSLSVNFGPNPPKPGTKNETRWK